MRWCGRAWGAIQLFEAKRLIYKHAAEVWKAVPQCEWVISRQILCMLSEVEFKTVNPLVRQMVTSMFSFGQHDQ